MLEQIVEEYKIKWEDEDVSHWNNIYSAAGVVHISRDNYKSKIAGNRLFRRKQFLFDTLYKEVIEDKLLLEVGCGKADTIATLLPPDKFNYNYIATDYSIEALKYLRKKYNCYRNITLIQCLGNHIPFADDTLDFLFSLGVLHHMPGKEKDICHLSKKIKRGGLLLLHEGFYRDGRFFEGCKIIDKWIEPDKSSHEERVDRRKLIELIGEIGDVRLFQCDYSPARTFLVKFAGNLMEQSVFITRCILIIDWLVFSTVGVLIKSLGPGECYAVVQKKKWTL